MRKIKKGDDVVILTGKDKGKRGTISKIIEQNYVHVQGVNTVKKHQKPNPNTGATGGIVDFDLPIHISNVAIYNPELKKGDRVGFSYDSDQHKMRIFRTNGEKI